MILPIFLLIEKTFLQLFDSFGETGTTFGTNIAIILFIVGILAVAVIVGRRFSKTKTR